jgi:kynurenine formamidase
MSAETKEKRENNWGRWGEDDERGALNLLTPESVLAALKTPKSGRIFPLSLPIQRSGVPNVEYRGIPQRLTMVNHDDEAMFEPYGASPGTGCNEDVLVMASHTVTHMDALCHIYNEGKIYNGFPHDEMLPYSGASRCGIEKSGGVVARGVLVDVAAHKGVDWLEPGYVVTLDDVKGALDAQRTELQPGDAMIVRTGWVEWFFAKQEMSLVQPGIGLDVAAYFAENDPVVVGADNTAVEAQPFDREEFLGCHVELLRNRGVHLVEHLKLDELSKEKIYEFLFIVSPLLITGATASPVSPVAIA